MATTYDKVGFVIDFDKKEMRDEDGEGFYF